MTATLPSCRAHRQAGEAAAGFCRAALIEDNRPFLGEWDQRPLALVARAEGDLVGGLVGGTARGLLFIEYFWLAPSHRRHGLGSRLLAEAEAEALRRGCRMAWLDTFDFQARAVLRAPRLQRCSASWAACPTAIAATS